MDSKELEKYLQNNLKIRLRVRWFDSGSDGSRGERLVADLLLNDKIISSSNITLTEIDN